MKKWAGILLALCLTALLTLGLCEPVDMGGNKVTITGPNSCSIAGVTYKGDGDTGLVFTGQGISISIKDGVKNVSFTLQDAHLEAAEGAAISIPAGCKATLILAGENTAVSGESWAGVSVVKKAQLTITSQQNQDGTWAGSLTTTGGYNAPGIGGQRKLHTGDIIINGGRIIATGKEYAAGIGTEGANGTPSGTLVINDGDITAYGGFDSAGIGGGWNSALLEITINGGTITANGGESGAGIGTGWGQDGLDITINGGRINAQGGGWGAGIGSSNTAKDAGRITITGGQISAYAGNDAAGIGGGWSSAGGTITITGGTLYASGGINATGIGSGSDGGNGGTIQVQGGSITAVGGTNGAGIGGGHTASGAKLVVSGGSISAGGGQDAAAIGGGLNGDGGKTEISGGTVEAIGGENGSGIGGGNGGNGGQLVVTGGTVTARAGKNASAIGGGKGGAGGRVKLSEGSVEAISQTEGIPAIGGTGNGGRLQLSGGSLTLTGSEPQYNAELQQTGGEIKSAQEDNAVNNAASAEATVTLTSLQGEEQAAVTGEILSEDETQKLLLISCEEDGYFLTLTGEEYTALQEQGYTALGLVSGDEVLLLTRETLTEAFEEKDSITIALLPAGEDTGTFTPTNGVDRVAYACSGEEDLALWMLFTTKDVPEYLWAE